MNAPASRTSRGFSVVELLVASTVGAVLTLLIATVFANSSKTGTVTESVNEIQEQARIALDMLQRDIRQAGYIGCNSNRVLNSGGLTNTMQAPASFLNNIGVYMQGHEGTGAGFSPAAPAGVTGATPAPVDTSDVVTLRIPSGEPVGVSGTMASASVVIPVYSTAGLGAGTRALVSDCAQTSAFRVTGTAGGLQHVAGAANTTANLGRAYGPDATVIPFATITYYIGPSSFAPLGTERSLWRRIDTTAASEEVAENVEDFQLLYGIDTNGDIYADIFNTADNVADWSQVVAVKASLLIHSKSASAAQTTQDYDFNGATDIAPGDHRLRRAFNVTMQLRNRSI
jgi:type IV pilus assembly protein PilW